MRIIGPERFSPPPAAEPSSSLESKRLTVPERGSGPASPPARAEPRSGPEPRPLPPPRPDPPLKTPRFEGARTSRLSWDMREPRERPTSTPKSGTGLTAPLSPALPIGSWWTSRAQAQTRSAEEAYDPFGGLPLFEIDLEFSVKGFKSGIGFAITGERSTSLEGMTLEVTKKIGRIGVIDIEAAAEFDTRGKFVSVDLQASDPTGAIIDVSIGTDLDGTLNAHASARLFNVETKAAARLGAAWEHAAGELERAVTRVLMRASF